MSFTDSDVGSTTSGASGSGKADAAKDQASQLGGHAASAASDVLGTAKSEAGSVAAEAKSSAKDLLSDATSQLHDQAGQQQERAASGLRAVSGQLGDMAEAADSGLAGSLVRQAADQTDKIASWLESRDSRGLVADVRSFASRRPGLFIGLAAGAGILTGRLVSGLRDTSTTPTTPTGTTHGTATPVATPSAYTTPTSASATPTDEPFAEPAVAPIVPTYGDALGAPATGDPETGARPL
jgi:hypothetical protein